MKKVYVTPRSITKEGHPSLKRLEDKGFEVILGPPGKQPTEEQQLEKLPQCDAYLAGIEPISEKVLEASKNLKIISRNGVGIDNIDLEAAQRLNIPIKIAKGSNSQGVAELAMAFILTSIRFIPLCDNRMTKGVWQREKGMEITGKNLGVVGTGNIGKKVIKMALGLGMYVLAYDIYPDQNFSPSAKFEYVEFEKLITNSEIITLHCPPSKSPLINQETIRKMKKGVIIINTARAAVVDDDATLEGLNSGKIKIYATDVYENEPPGITDLIRHERTITTPHIGGYTVESINRAAEMAVENIIEMFK